MSGNLDRIQIVKGWLDADGNAQEKVYNVVWGDADKRQTDAAGKLPPVGNTVNGAKATWTNTIGDPELITVWTDPSSIRSAPPSTTLASSRSQRPAGPLSTRSDTASSSPTRSP